MENSNSPVVFSHNDLQEGNILLPNSAKNDPNGNDLGLVFIDFEYASYNYRGFDFANHFIEYTICYDIDETPYYKISKDKFPDERHMLMFMRSYLSEINPNVSQDDLERESRLLIKEALPFVPASHLFWSVWSFLQSITSPLSFGFAVFCLLFNRI
jgi:choline/ethanolamine kinase